MDGIIIDSMPYHYISWFEALKEQGVRVTPADVFEMEGAKWDKVIKFAFKRDKKKLSADIERKIFSQREEFFNKHFTRYLFEGIEDMIKRLKEKGFLIGLVTGSRLHEAKKMIPADLYNILDTVVAGNMVKKGKPHPDSYILAAKNLKLKPSECMVVENAPYGIKAAKAAKMFCAAIATSLPKDKLEQADIVFDTHQDFYKYLGK